MPEAAEELPPPAREGRRAATLGRILRFDVGRWLAAELSTGGIRLILGLGILFRLAQYLADRPYWYDEGQLAAVIHHKTCAEMFGPLGHGQLAPAGFLVLQRLAFLVLGPSDYALRLLPLAGGLAALFLVLAVARRVLAPGAVPVALALAAVADDLIYFASELKPYSTDVAVGLACLLLGLKLGSRPLTARRLAASSALGALAVWFSFPAAFVLAGVGVVLLASALAGRRWRRAAALAAMGLAWVVSLAACRAVAIVQLADGWHMYAFWWFAFLPLPPRSLGDLAWPLRHFLYLFVNPLNFETPLGPSLSTLPAVALFAIGAASLWRRDRRVLGMLALPGLFALLASGLHAYPFHGRMVLFLVPLLLLIIAEGVESVRRTSGRRSLWTAALLALFLFPASHDLICLFFPRQRYGLNPHGDLRPSDYEPDQFPFFRPPESGPFRPAPSNSPKNRADPSLDHDSGVGPRAEFRQ